MKKIDLTDGFDAGRMSENSISNAALTAYLIKNIKPIGGLLDIMKDGCGIAVVRNGDDLSIIGVDMEGWHD